MKSAKKKALRARHQRRRSRAPLTPAVRVRRRRQREALFWLTLAAATNGDPYNLRTIREPDTKEWVRKLNARHKKECAALKRISS